MRQAAVPGRPDSLDAKSGPVPVALFMGEPEHLF